jgi:hypothetical protein
MNSAIQWATRVPNPHGEGGESEIEIRQFLEVEDFIPSVLFHDAAESGKESAKIKTQAM